MVFPSEIKRKFCKENCRKAYLESLRVTTECATCHTPLNKTKSAMEASKSGLTFCSSSCSIVHWNSDENIKRRRPEGKCFKCSAIIRKNRKYCKNCGHGYGPGKSIVGSMTIQDLCDKYYNSPYLKSAAIRSHSRRFYAQSSLPKKCIVCGYDKFYEVSHFIPIKAFSASTKIDVVNALSNLVALCPNCHWELDHNMINKEELAEKIKSRGNGT